MFSIARTLTASRQSLSQASRSFSTTASTADYARMQLLGRLVADPETRTTRSGKDYVRYTLATSDPSGPPSEDGTQAPQTSSFHNVFAFGDSAVQRLQGLTKGTQMVVDAEFRVQRNPAAEDGSAPAGQTYLVQHKSCHVIRKGQTQE